MADYSSTGPPRRFRRRGGAKKKKKQHSEVTSEPWNSAIPNDENYPQKSHSWSSKPSEPTFPSALETDLVTYLVQMRDDLDKLQDEEQYPRPIVSEMDEETPVLLLARNGLASLRPQLHEVSMDPNGSRVLESLVRAARPDVDAIAETLSSLLELGSRRVAALAQHRCGSHVLQTLVEIVAESSDGSERVVKAMEGVCKLLNDWTVDEVADIISSPCGSHVFRAVTACLAGLPADEPREQKLDDSLGSKRVPAYLDFSANVPNEWLEAVGEVARRFLDPGKGELLANFVWHPATCAALQGLLSAVARYDQALTKDVVRLSLGDSSMLDLCFDTHGARFVERVVVCLGASFVLPKIKGNLAKMACDSKANFVVQRVLLSLRGRGAVMSAWDELEPELTKMVSYGSSRDGVVLAMLRAAEVEGDEQVRRRAARGIAKAVGAMGKSAKFLCGILVTGSSDRWERWREGVQGWADSGMGVSACGKPVSEETDILQLGGGLPGISLLGVLKARCLLRFPGGPGQGARDSMANLTSSEILALSSDSAGSRLIEQWMSSDEEHGSNKAYLAVMSAVLDADDSGVYMGAMARNVYGAQVLVRAIPRVQGDVRKRAMEALAARADRLREHDYGRQVIRKCRVEDFMRRRDDWTNEESARDRRYRLFSDLLTVDETNNEEKVTKERIRSEKKRKKVAFEVESCGILSEDDHVVDQGPPTKFNPEMSVNDDGSSKEADINRKASTKAATCGDLGKVLMAISEAADPTRKSKRKKVKEL